MSKLKCTTSRSLYIIIVKKSRCGTIVIECKCNKMSEIKKRTTSGAFYMAHRWVVSAVVDSIRLQQYNQTFTVACINTSFLSYYWPCLIYLYPYIYIYTCIHFTLQTLLNYFTCISLYHCSYKVTYRKTRIFKCFWFKIETSV